MSCGVCGHSWCWVCGFESYNCWHKLAGDGALCELINSSMKDNKWWSKFPKCLTLMVAFIILIVAPILAFIPGIFVAAYYVTYNLCRHKHFKFRWIKKLMYAFLYFCIFLPLSAVFLSLAAAVIGPIYYLFIVTLIIIMIFRWIIGSKKVS